jgi:hypothetical protein
LHAGNLGDTDPIDVESIEVGIKLAHWCENEAERVYSMLAEPDEEREVRVTVELVNRLAARNGGRVTVKQIQNANGRKYRTRDAAEAALDMLVNLKLGRWEDGPVPPAGGKRLRWYIPNPTSDDSDDRPTGETDDGPAGPSDDCPPSVRRSAGGYTPG